MDRRVIRKARVTLADDHPIVLAGLRNLIEAEADLDFVGEATSGQAALKLIREKLPDVAVVDISMPEFNGIILARRLAEECPSVRVLVLTLHEDRSYVKQALEAGVRGYVLKRSAAENLVQAIRSVLADAIYVDPAIATGKLDGKPARAARSPATANMPDLTERETAVLKYSARGFTNKEIAGRLDVSEKTVETYKARAIEKLNLKTRAEIVRFASAQGWLADI
jgi:DNA-binding NarL/FixJ family response regulator